MVSRDRLLAGALSAALAREHPGKRLYALAGSEFLAAARSAGLKVVGEAFADRSYRADASLTPRSEPGAVIVDPDAAVAQVLGIATESAVYAGDGTRIPIDARTICIHGDSAHAVDFARRIRDALARAGVGVKA